jgi:hypothetical protein
MSSKSTAAKKSKSKAVLDVPHRARKIPVRVAEVDIEIIPIVQWLNQFRSIHTLYSCEGNDKADEVGKPYVSFLCTEPEDLVRALNGLGADAEVEVDLHNGVLRYCARFRSKYALEDVTERIQRFNW